MLRNRSISLLSIFAVAATALVFLAPQAGAVPAPVTLAYVKGIGIWTAQSDGSQAKLILAFARDPKVSPDGTRIAYFNASGSWVANIDGSGAHQLAMGTAFPVDWSPDGTQVLLSATNGLVIADATSGAHHLIPNTADAQGGSWSPDGTLIAYASGRTQVLIRPDGTGRTVRSGFYFGDWSPTGTEMAVLVIDELASQNVITGALSNIVPIPGNESVDEVTWTPDGAGICAAYTGDVSPGAPPGAFTGVACPHASIPGASQPSMGGGPRPTDTNGTPGPVTGLSATPSPSTVALSWTPPASTPDFAGVSVRYALGNTPPATVTSGLDGGRLLVNATSLQGLPPDQPVSISVFSRDWFGNVSAPATATVTTPHKTLSALAVHASPFDMTYETRSVVTGTLVDSFHRTPIAGATLAISRRVWQTTGAFQPVGSATTNAQGAFTFTQAPSISYDYLISYAGDANHSAASFDQLIRIAHRVSIAANHPSAPAGSSVELTAHTLPPLPNGRSYLAARNQFGVAVRLGPHPTSSTGAVIYTVRAPARGQSVAYRVEVPGSNHYIDGASPWIVITGT
jgi:hypothetical protein